jgi:serine/threonine-protein kinase
MGSTGKAAGFPRRFGKYTLLSHLATGGMADVFLARQLGPGGFQKECVIKRVLPQLVQDPSNQAFVEMFLQEARIAARLSHPNIVHILDFGQIDGDYFLAMEYVDGVTIESVLEKTRSTGQPALPWPVAVRIVSSVAEGLDHAHKAKDSNGSPLLLVHRDVSPSNIMVSWDGVAKVLDFGIAKAMSVSIGGSKVRTGIGIIKGKVPYMSPEQIQGLDLDARSDVFSLAAVLYELTTGQRPFPGETTGKLTLEITSREPRPPEQFNPAFPPDLHPILMRGLAKSVDKRYQSARDFKVDLEQFLADQHSSCSNYDVEAYLKELIPIEERPRPELPSADEIAQLEAEADSAARTPTRRSDGAIPALGSAAQAAGHASADDDDAATAPSQSTPSALASGTAIDALEAEERRRKRDRGGGSLVMAAIGLLVVGTAVVFFVLHKLAVARQGAEAQGNTAPISSPLVPSPTSPTPPPSTVPTATQRPEGPTPTVAADAKPAEVAKPKAEPVESAVENSAPKPTPDKPDSAKPETAKSAAKPAKKGKKPDEGSRPSLSLPPPPPADPE